MANKYDKLIADYEHHCRRIASASTLKIGETPAARQERVTRLERRYVDWFGYYFANYAKSPCSWFHARLAEQVVKRRDIKAVVKWYRSAAKSVHVDMGIPLYLYFVKRDMFYMLLVGETEDKAKKLISGVQAQLQYNKRLINDYGDRYKYGDWSAGSFLTTDGVRFEAIGFGQSPRGAREDDRRPDYIAVDDVDNRRHINNDRLMEEGVSYITEDLMGCFDAADGAAERLVYACNDYHKSSITHRLGRLFETLAANLKRDGLPSPYYVTQVNAIKDLTSFTPEWPEKTSAGYWRKKFAGTPYRSFMREYMNMHIADGAVFKADNIVYGPMLPLAKYDGLCVYGDMSYKDTGDYKAMLLVGKVGRKYHILAVYLRRSSRAACAAWLYDLYERLHLDRRNVRYYIEGLFAMDDFVNDFDLEGDSRGYHIPVVADKRPKGEKYDRVESTVGIFERGDVLFNETLQGEPDMTTLVDQFLAFERGSRANDDGPDAWHGAVTKLNAITYVDKFNPVVISRQEVLARSKNRY